MKVFFNIYEQESLVEDIPQEDTSQEDNNIIQQFPCTEIIKDFEKLVGDGFYKA